MRRVLSEPRKAGVPGLAAPRRAKRAWHLPALPAPGRIGSGACMAVLAWLALGLLVEGAGLWQGTLRAVDVRGHRVLSAREVVRLADVRAGMRLSGIDPLAMAEALARTPRIAGADVRRIFPSRLRITLRERVPVAAVLTAPDVMALVDRGGRVLEVAPARKERAARLPRIRLPMPTPVEGQHLSGPRLARALELIEGLGAAAAMEGLVIEARHPFSLRALMPGLARQVVFPSDGLEESLALYRRIRWPAGGGGDVRIVDLRMAAQAHGARIVVRRGK